jgi:spermidine synthase
MRSWARGVFFVVFALTGFSALVLQVVWQRVISVHAGVDLVSFTTVVAAFLAGIGLGSLAGGWLADRLGARASVLAFAFANLLIGVFAWVSTWLFYDFYEQHAESLTSPWSKFAFNFALLLLPTILMGLSLPLVAKGLVERIGDAGSLVGRLYSVNTLGAAAGAAIAGWKLLGTYGFVTTTRIAGAANVVAAMLVLVVYAYGRRGVTASDTSVDASVGAVADRPSAAASGSDPDGAAAGTAVPDRVGALGALPWYFVYALTGAVALGFEVVFFRMIDTIMRSNSYSFAHVLAMYLLFFGLGSAIASPIVKRSTRPDQWFLWLQFAVGVTALLGPIVLTKVLPHTSFATDIKSYLGSEGFEVGFDRVGGGQRTDILQVFFGVPLLIMALPVLGMGASFPFVQALVSERLDVLGRRTGLLIFANVVGNVFGTLVVGFLIIDRIGTSGTYRVLGVALLVPALAAAYLARGTTRRRIFLGVAAVLVMALFVRFFPSNPYLYATLNGVELGEFRLAEDRTCSNGLRSHGDGSEEMTINGASQNAYPFDDFHVLIGLTPTLMHKDPKQVMAVGLGIGATPYGLSLDDRVDAVHAVEICGPEVTLLKDLGDRRSTELRSFFGDPRLDMQVGDGRDYLLRTKDQLDVVVIDTLRQQSGYSGNVYSK